LPFIDYRVESLSINNKFKINQVGQKYIKKTVENILPFEVIWRKMGFEAPEKNLARRN
jgi:hypothetical protein